MYTCYTLDGYYWSSQDYQQCPVEDDTVHPPSEPSEPAQASKHSGDRKYNEQPGKYASGETRETALYIHTSKTIFAKHWLVLRNYVTLGRQPEQNRIEVVDFLEELHDLIEQQKHISSKVDDVVFRIHEALQQLTHKSLPKGGKLVRWADSARAHGSDDDTRRPRKRARRGS